MPAAFALPSVNGGPHHMKLGIAAPDPAVDALSAELDPGQWEIVRFAGADVLSAAVEKREAAGGLALGPGGAEVFTASAGGAGAASAITAIGTTVAQQQQLPVQTHDVVPFPGDDPRGAGLTAAALPMVVAETADSSA